VQPVRSEALPLAVELHKYMGAALRPSYDGLRTAQQKEIDDAFASAEKPAPARMTRSVAAVASKPVDAADGSSAAPRAAPADAPMAFDASDFADPVDVLSKLPKDFCEKVLTLPKWTEKKEMLDVLIQAASTPKIVPGDYHELVKTLKKLMADSMVVVVTSAVTAAGLLATGLRKEFSQCTKLLLSTLLDRLKEKDFRVRDAVHAALENMIGTGKCVAMADVVEDFCTALGPKGSPKAKVEIYRFLHKSITQANGSIALKAIKPLTDALVKGVDDSAPEVREGSSSVLGALLTAFGADSMKKVLESLDEKKRKKVESMATGPQAATAAPEPAAAAKPVVALKKAPVKASDSEGPKKTAGKVAVSKPATAGAKPKAAGEKQEAKTEIVDLNAGMSVEELDAQMETLYSEATRTKLASANWKERLEGMEEVLASLVERGALEQPVPDATCRMVQGLLVTKKETNFQVVAKGFEVVKLIAEKAGKFSKRAAHWLVTPLVEKLGDVKLKTAASECLTSLAEACSPDFMLSQALGVLEKTKAPKTLENAVGWINTLCGDFGMKLIKPTPVLVFVKGMLEVANPAVKKAAIQALVTLRRLLGPDLRNMLSDVKPALLTSIDEAFAKVADEEPMEAPKRQVRCVDEVAGAAAAGPGDEIVNLTAPIAAHIKALGDANWKERQSAIVAIDELVTKAKPLGCQGPYMEGSCGEMWAALKARLKDSNKNLATQVLALLGKIADAVGPSVDKYSKHVMPNMLALISDNKKTVRDAVVQCLAVWARHISSETVIKYLPIALTVESPAGREDAFKWAADYLAARDKSEPVDLTPILVPVMDGLVFRTAEVRNGAERCLSVIYEGGGKQAINNVLRDMKPAQLKGVKPICEKAEKAAASATTSAAPTKEVAAISIESPPEAGAPGAEVVGEVKPTGADVVSSSAVGKANNKAASLEPAPPVEVSAADEHGKLLRCNRGKDVREKKNGKTKWVLEDAKEVEELIVLVKEQMEKETDSQLHAKLFHKDFKKQVDGIKELTVFAPQHAAEVIDNLDLLLRMCSLRMVQKACNTSVLLAVLELLKALTDLCVANTYYLTETEANVILPVLLQEIGSNNESIRGQMREVVKKVTHVYPASKMFSFAMDAALNTRNQRSKAEVLAEMAALVDRLGLDQVCVPCKALPMMASMIGERDVLVRNAACDFFAAAFSSIGDKIWKYIDKKLEPKDKDILEARLKKVKTTVPASAPAAKPGAADLRRSMPEMAASEKPAPDVRASVNLETARSVETPLRRASKHQVAELLEAPTPTIHNIRSRFQEEHNVESVFVDSMRLIAEGDVEEQIAAFRALSDSIDKVEGKLVEKNFNAIASCVQMELARLLADSATSSDFRLAKHAIHTLHQVFEKQPVAAQSLKDCTTGRLLEEILLLSIELQSNEDAKSLLAGLNEVMMDTLHSANPNHCFTSLIRFLYEGANLSGERVATPEFVDNALRALLEMARSMQECMGKLDVDMLLYDCHMFLVSHPPSKYRGKEFRPLRLLKTILNELVKIKGGGIRDHLTLVPVETKPTLCSYIELVLQQHLSSQSRAAGDKSDSKLDIASIFDKIGSKEKDVAKEVFLSCIVMRGWETRGCVAGAFMPHNPPRSLSMLLVVFR
jgi:cytoskeleton-associated protein 5